MSVSQFSGQNGQSDATNVTLTDDAGRSLDCFVENAIEQAESIYCLLRPVDSPIAIIAWEDEDDSEEATAIWLEDETEIEQIFADAKAVLAEFNLILKNTAFTLTVAGELPEVDEEEILTLEIEEPDGYLDTDEFQLLATVYNENREYEIYTPITPLLLFAKQNQTGKLELLSPEQLQQLQPLLEEFLFEQTD